MAWPSGCRRPFNWPTSFRPVTWPTGPGCWQSASAGNGRPFRTRYRTVSRGRPSLRAYSEIFTTLLLARLRPVRRVVFVCPIYGHTSHGNGLRVQRSINKIRIAWAVSQSNQVNFQQRLLSDGLCARWDFCRFVLDFKEYKNRNLYPRCAPTLRVVSTHVTVLKGRK
jgi:hypothetical protein